MDMSTIEGYSVRPFEALLTGNVVQPIWRRAHIVAPPKGKAQFLLVLPVQHGGFKVPRYR